MLLLVKQVTLIFWEHQNKFMNQKFGDKAYKGEAAIILRRNQEWWNNRNTKQENKNCLHPASV